MSDDMKVREAAEFLGVHENTIRNWVKTGLLDDESFARLPSGVMRFNRERVKQMRDEMWSGFAPADEMPGQRPTATGQQEAVADPNSEPTPTPVVGNPVTVEREDLEALFARPFDLGAAAKAMPRLRAALSTQGEGER